MLSEETAMKLATFTHREDARRVFCWLPISGIVWDDEIPDVKELGQLPEEDRNQILKLFGLRVRRWRGDTLVGNEHQFWEELRAQVPEWAFFQRQTATADDLRAQDQVDKETTEFLEQMCEEADEATVTEGDGFQSFSATFDLTKKQSAIKTPSLWERLLNRWR